MPTSTASSRPGSDRLELFGLRALLPDGDEAREALAAAASEAQVAAAASAPADAPRAALVTLLAELLPWLAVRGEIPPSAADTLEQGADLAGVDSRTVAFEVAARATRDPRLAALPPSLAIEALLRLVRTLSGAAHVSLWCRAGGTPRCRHFEGPGCPSRSVRDTARQTLYGGPNGSRRGLLQVVVIEDGDAILIARPRPGASNYSQAVLRLASRPLRLAVDRCGEIEREAPAAEMLAAASERRTARIGFDLHDGPIQSLAALIGDARLLGSQVALVLANDERREMLAGRLDDLKARMVALEFELRCMCHSLEAPAVLCRPFERVIEHEAVAFQRVTGIDPAVELSGDFEAMTPSQRIALIRVVQEALRNVSEHSRAHNVAVRIRAHRGAAGAVVEDDGMGFDVNSALARAVKDGRVGLIGMMERIRLLGGRCEVRSAPRGPSTVTVSLPAWHGG